MRIDSHYIYTERAGCIGVGRCCREWQYIDRLTGDETGCEALDPYVPDSVGNRNSAAITLERLPVENRDFETDSSALCIGIFVVDGRSGCVHLNQKSLGLVVL